MTHNFAKPKRNKSLANALAGLAIFFKTQVNGVIHLGFALIAIALGCFFKISYVEWLTLILTIAMVLTAEIINTALEFLADAFTLEFNEKIRAAKDLAAGAVLVSALFSIITGCIIFAPKIFALLE